jgi:hypothetical protein
MTSLTPDAVHKALSRFFPAKNDDFPSDYAEELAELRHFGIATEEQLDELLHRRAEEVMEIDRSPMSESDIRMHSEDSGEEFVANRLREESGSHTQHCSESLWSWSLVRYTKSMPTGEMESSNQALHRMAAQRRQLRIRTLPVGRHR